MLIFRPRYALSLAFLLLALLAGGALDRALEFTHNRLLSAAIGEEEENQPRPRPSTADADAVAVVVLGYALARDGAPSPALEHRVRAAVREWERSASREEEDEGNEVEDGGGVEKNKNKRKKRRVALVFSGGHPGGGLRGLRSEAEVMRDLAEKLLLSLPLSDGAAAV